METKPNTAYSVLCEYGEHLTAYKSQFRDAYHSQTDNDTEKIYLCIGPSDKQRDDFEKLEDKYEARLKQCYKDDEDPTGIYIEFVTSRLNNPRYITKKLIDLIIK